MSIYSKLGTKYKTIEEFMTNEKLEYDTDFDKTSMISRYYTEFGTNAAIGTVAGFVAGTHNATDLINTGLSLLGSNTSRNSVGSFLIDTAQSALRFPIVSDVINNALPSLNLLNISNSKIAPAQLIPGERFLASQRGSVESGGSSFLNSLLDTGKEGLSNLITNIASTGTATVYDFTRAFESGLEANNINYLSRLGLKYTQNVGFVDPTMPKWKKYGNSKNITFDKYSGYYNKESRYDSLHPNTEDGSEILYRYNATFEGRSSKFSNIPVDKIKIEKIKSGYPAKPFDEKTDEYYIDKKTIEIENEKISPGQYRERLGFPITTMKINEFGLDLINMLDVGDNYNRTDETLRDSIKFIFEDISTNGINSPIPIIFRATITDLSDSVSPGWDEVSFIGRADKFYTYTGFTRSISFNFSVYSNSPKEVPSNWRKLNRLYGMCYPVEYQNKIAMKAPLLRLTIGDMYNGIYGIFNSFSLTPNGDSFWETEDGYQLPHVVDVSVEFTVIYEPNTAVDSNNNIINLAPTTNSHHFIHGKEKFKNKFNTDLIYSG